MKKELKYLILCSLMVLVGCSSEDDAAPHVPNRQPQPGDALELTVTASDFVTDGAPYTRATDNGPVTTFENNDRVGIIILDKDGQMLYKNIPYKYVSSSGTWVFDSNNSEGKEICYYDSKAYTYIVYYPYSANADDCKNESDLKSKFKPQTQQNTKEAYRASDLMVSTTTSGTPLKSLTAKLKHVYASISLSLPTTYKLDDEQGTKYNIKVSDVNLTIGDHVYVPYQAIDGSFRCILPADITPGDIRCFYSFYGGTYCNIINISDKVIHNTRYTSVITKPYYTLADAKVGDFYCRRSDNNNGYLIPGEVALTDAQQNACIGIVYCTDLDRIGQAAKEALKGKNVDPHGLVMALTNASENCQWGNYSIDENSGGAGGTSFQDNTSTLQKQYNNVDGYGETHWILYTYRNGTTLQDTYTAFYHASRYGTVDSGTAKYAAPNTTTGWFIPSMGQWWDILSNLGGIDLTTYRESSKVSQIVTETISVDNINKYLGKIKGTTNFSIATFWSSSEYSSLYACSVYFLSSGALNLNYASKGGSNLKVRCVFAF